MNEIVTAVIGGVCVAVPSIVATIVSNKKSTALTLYRIQALEEEVRMHNNFARRMPVVEEQIKNIEEDIRDLKK